MKKILSMLMLASALTTTAFADDIQLGEPGYAGQGCPSGSASVTLSPDNKALSILFDEYFVEAGGRKKLQRKNCTIAIPVHVPTGFSVSLIDVDYRGYVMVPRGGMARFTAEYFFAGKRGPRYNKTFRGGFDNDYTIQNQLGVFANVWSACGADVNLRVNTAMLLKTNRQGDDALATVDSADISAGIVYHLKWKRCGGGSDDFDDFF
jgi:hypothetical protein